MNHNNPPYPLLTVRNPGDGVGIVNHAGVATVLTIELSGLPASSFSLFRIR